MENDDVPPITQEQWLTSLMWVRVKRYLDARPAYTIFLKQKIMEIKL